jgi:putative SbcD/Mre11-related phosphoesterase
MRPVYGHRALLLGDHLVIADLHIGIEEEFRQGGIRVPKQLPGMAERIHGLLDRTGARRLVILGDLKHNIPGISRAEYRDIPPFVGGLQERVKVVLVKGNHDGDIEGVLPEVEVVASLEVGDYLLTHGHRRIENLDYKGIILAHNHPCISFRDQMGGVSKESAWIRGRLKESVLEDLGLERGPEIVIMPAFNEILSETPVNTPKGLLGPLFRKGLVDLEGAEAVLLDGTHLGRIKDLR